MVVLSGFPPSSLRRVVSYQSYVRNHVVIHGFVVIRMIWGAGSLAGGGGGGGGIGSGGELKGEFLHKLRHLSHGGCVMCGVLVVIMIMLIATCVGA